jgi:hypothetical protein
LHTLSNFGALSASSFLHKEIILIFDFPFSRKRKPPHQIVSSSGCATTTRILVIAKRKAQVLIKLN